MSLLDTVRFILDHPLNSGNRLGSLWRFASWQIGARLVPGPVAVDFVEGTRLLVSRGQAGATGNIYTGLHELSEMAFVLHMLREGDLFVDVGANVGSYTVLAAGVTGANVVAFEPGAKAYRSLLDNVRLNDLGALVESRNEAAGDKVGEVQFTQNADTVNHVVALASDDAPAVNVPMNTLDNALAGRVPVMMKIDVEGFESSVIAGAPATLAGEQLQSVVMETNGSGAGYGASDDELHAGMIRAGFTPCRYEPFTRKVEPIESYSSSGNTIYVRDVAFASARVAGARKLSIAGHGYL